MLNPLLVMRHRLWQTARKRGAALSQTVGNRPLLTGIAGTLIAVAMAGLTLATLYAGRTDALDHARETSANLVSLISSDLERNVEIYDLSLQEIVYRAQEPTVWRLPDAMRRTVLFDRATLAAHLGGAYVIDKHGVLKATQQGPVDKEVRFDDRDFFVVHQRDPHAGLFVSHPYRSRLRDQELSFALSRRIDALDGSFAGIALLAVRIDYLQRLLDRVNTGRMGTAFILRDDGVMLARKPFIESTIGLDTKQYALPMVSAGSAGSYIGESSIDHVRRIFSYAHVPGVPLVVVVAPAVDDVLAQWRRRSAIAGGLTFMLSAVVVLVCWTLVFTLRDKVRAQARFAELAATDPLTRLSNRRTLDRHLDEEWRRARRTGAPLSALFIDIDHFKRFNDTYGHAAGDEVLVAVADCIASVARRSIDVVARYGGEEFAVVLPDTQSMPAAGVAEKIRRIVEALHSGGAQSRDYGTVTVSVGCATCRPAEGGNAHDLLAAADEQLYAAKAAGRNQVKSVDRSLPAWARMQDEMHDRADSAQRRA